MSIDLGQLLGDQISLVQASKAMRAWVQSARLKDKPFLVQFKRDGSYLPAQTVRLEFENSLSTEEESSAGVGFSRRGILFGVKDHPTLPDLDVQMWDTFVLDKEEFTILQVNSTLLGQVQCQFEAVGS